MYYSTSESEIVLLAVILQQLGVMRLRIKIGKPTTESHYGILYKQATIKASNNLSGDAFKVYVVLSLNQPGYIYRSEISESVVSELRDRGYLVQGEGEMVFCNVPRAGAASPQPVQPPPRYEPPVQDNEMYVYVGSPEPVQELEYDDSDLPF